MQTKNNLVFEKLQPTVAQHNPDRSRTIPVIERGKKKKISAFCGKDEDKHFEENKPSSSKYGRVIKAPLSRF